MTDYQGPDHTMTVTVYPYRHYNADTKTWTDEVDIDREFEHPAECDALKYGELCALDRHISMDGADELPSEAGKYRVRYWSTGPDYWGEYDAGLTVETVATDETAPVDAERAS